MLKYEGQLTEKVMEMQDYLGENVLLPLTIDSFQFINQSSSL